MSTPAAAPLGDFGTLASLKVQAAKATRHIQEAVDIHPHHALECL
jgi:hypothetical protein